jgi:hypothetical protein
LALTDNGEARGEGIFCPLVQKSYSMLSEPDFRTTLNPKKLKHGGDAPEAAS